MAKKQSRIDALLDELLKDEDPKELFNKDGLLEDLTKRLVERALEGDLTDHLGYQKNERQMSCSTNARNGITKKTTITNRGSLDIEVPRDQDGDFEPQLVRKRQKKLPGFHDKVIALYARGMTVREIQGHLKDLYSVEVSPRLISNVTDSVIDDVRQWQSRPLDTVYPIVYLDAIYLKISKGSHVENRAVYLALGVNLTR
ncbi:putative transposase [Desulfoluna spongiiphila]|uniref:Mutator family transposase n=1 Tax=Desulfoluna spongiiphila TaxID=419481 RepID=A0A1G5GZH8_9BACT|nr:putative transposase [Desulfoluna spongiiphila]